ncbi:uncharacterized protein LOC142563710 isoform X2 [Dermacentor variabilis]|uniref:uncharacterized protein LOC142563710 isoform X2 n=1 Tax=Dermacentor variabilis TaxID=34621 RepID=UPI003F5B4EB0
MGETFEATCPEADDTFCAGKRSSATCSQRGRRWLDCRLNASGPDSLRQPFCRHPPTWHIGKTVFGQVELYFRNHSIMISVKIGSVSEKNDLSSYSGKSLDERATLKNVTAYGNSLGQPSNTIFYLFSWSTFRFASTSVTTGAESQSAVETDGTFCTNNTSGAVILHAHETGTAWSTIKATAFVFGSRHFTKFYEEDRKKMNATFLMCPKHTTIPDVLAC